MSQTITPMRTAGAQFLIERTNRESGSYQWVRETLINAIEAKATHIEFGVEWQAVRSKGVYRRIIADNGQGMNPEQLVAFFNTFGAGAKAIGGVHENFGVGAKTSLLPWNRLGMVVISWQKGIPAMIWMMRDPDTGEYGLRVLPAIQRGRNVLDTVFAPFNDPDHGCDWRLVKPAFIKDHGTVVVLLGKALDQDTVLGDPYRSETDIKGISAYLNHRIWDMHGTGARVYVTEFRTQDKKQWPKTPHDGKLARVQNREIHGARYWLMYTDHPGGKLEASGIVAHEDVDMDWYLWSGSRPSVHTYAPEDGFIGVLYKNELYDVTAHHSTYRSFGITERTVRARTWVIVRPPLIDPKRGGVYPRTDRNALLFKPKGVGNASRPIPLADWAAWFADHLPEEIQRAIIAARGAQTVTLDDEIWRARLAERFGDRWKIEKLRESESRSALVRLDQSGTSPLRAQINSSEGTQSRGRDAPVIESGRQGALTTGSEVGDSGATLVKVSGGIPHARWETGSEFDEGMLAAWSPHDQEFPEGVVLLNRDHPMIVSQIKYWQEQYAEHHADEIADEVRLVYGQVAVAKLAHSEHMKGIIPAQVVETDLRSEVAMTMALLGLIAEESILQRRLDGKFRRKESGNGVGVRLDTG